MQSDPFKHLRRKISAEKTGHAAPVPVPGTIRKDRLRALFQVVQQVNSILDLEELFQEIIRQVVELLGAERAAIVMKEGSELVIKAFLNIDKQAEENALRFSRSIVDASIREAKTLYSSNALSDKRFSRFQTIHNLPILSFICAPIIVKGEIIGTIYVDNRHVAHSFQQEDADLLQAFANLLGITITNVRAFHEIAELNRTLEQKVKERTRELEKAIEDLKRTRDMLVQAEKMASLGRLVGGFMHEFNNPINFIYSNLTHLENYYQQLVRIIERLKLHLPEKEIQELLGATEYEFIKDDFQKLIAGFWEGAHRSLKIVEDLKRFAKQSPGQFKPMNLSELVEKTVHYFQQQTADKVRVELEREGECWIQGNPAELNQIISNLLQNSMDAGASQIRLKLYQREDMVTLVVADNGKGIPPSIRQKIFDPFFTTKEVGKGMGLGLALVYNMVSHHGGEIELVQPKDGGAEFHITFPALKEHL